jgi:hypothetical protein
VAVRKTMVEASAQGRSLNIELATPCKSGTSEARRVDELGRLHGRIRLGSERALAAWYVRAIAMDRLNYWAIAKALLRDDPSLVEASGGDYNVALRSARQRVGRQSDHLLAKYSNHGSMDEPGTWIHVLMGNTKPAPDWSQRLVSDAAKALRGMGEIIQGAVVREDGKVKREPLPPEDVLANARCVCDYLDSNGGVVPDGVAPSSTIEDRQAQAKRARAMALKRARAAVRACVVEWQGGGDMLHLEVVDLIESASTDLRAACIALGLEAV